MKNIKIDWRTGAKFGMGSVFIITGLVMNSLGVGGSFDGFGTAGTYMTYVGFIAIIIGILTMFRKKKVVDERMLFVASKSARLTFMAFMVFAFAIVVIDGINPIKMPYNLFMSYLVCGMLLFYTAAYTVMLKMA